MEIRSFITRGGVALVALVGFASAAAMEATAQEASPVAAPHMATPVAGAPIDVPLLDASGAAVGLATFSEDAAGVTVTLLIEGLAPGEHGWHLHEMGVCDAGGAEPFESAGGHWNPTTMAHGAPDDPEHHVGDFGNLTASEAGLAEATITTSDFSLGDGPTSVFDEDGTAIIVHEGMDDLTTQPDGDAGTRFACGVAAEPMAMPAATPVGMATPVA
jgi:Cu-Zn family superoxide dismutase